MARVLKSPLILVFISTFGFLTFFAPRIITYLDPVTGDEPFYLMTAISLINDHDLNECNNFIEQQERSFYPPHFGTNAEAPKDWTGWSGAPFPLPPHPTQIQPSSRQCSSDYSESPIEYDKPQGELYSKHGLGLSLAILFPFLVAGRVGVVLFLNFLGALLALNVYALSFEVSRSHRSAFLTWLAFAFSTPLFFYSYLIFPELPAALLVAYSYRRIRLNQNHWAQILAVSAAIALLPWLHYRFLPISVGLGVYYLFATKRSEKRSLPLIAFISLGLSSLIGMATLNHFRYGTFLPPQSDHAGMGGMNEMLNGVLGFWFDRQWGIFPVAPILVIAFSGLFLMVLHRVREFVWLFLITVPYYLLVSSYLHWWGEWCPPGRYLVVILPLLAVPFSYMVTNGTSRIFASIYWLLFFITVSVTAIFLFHPPWLYNFSYVNNQADTSSNLLEAVPGLIAEIVGIPSLATIDLSKLFPSFVGIYLADYDLESAQIVSQLAYNELIDPSLFLLSLILICVLCGFRNSQLTWASGARSRTECDPTAKTGIR